MVAILSPTTLVIRIWDALRAFFAVLVGSRALRSIPPSLSVKHNAEVSSTLIELASTIEKLNMWAARVAQRDAREARRLLAEGPKPEATPQAPTSVKDRKLMLRAARRAQRFGGQIELPAMPVAPATPQEMDGDDEPSD